MKRLSLVILCAGLFLTAQTARSQHSYGHSGYHGGGHGYYGGHHGHHHSGTSYSFSFGYPAFAYPSYPAYYPAYAAYPAYPSYAPVDYGYYPPSRPNYAVGGTLLGALVGGIIGNNVHHQTWEGAAIGAGAGLLLGGAAEYAAQKQAPRTVPVQPFPQPPAPPPPAPSTQPAPTPQAQPPPPNKTAVRGGPSNATYYWTSAPAGTQIANAPRVPAAPTLSVAAR
jgi:hypothetical protein